MLLVSSLRTSGQVIKHHDAHIPESGEQSPLYQQALRDRAAIEAGGPPPARVLRRWRLPGPMRRSVRRDRRA